MWINGNVNDISGIENKQMWILNKGTLIKRFKVFDVLSSFWKAAMSLKGHRYFVILHTRQ